MKILVWFRDQRNLSLLQHAIADANHEPVFSAAAEPNIVVLDTPSLRDIHRLRGQCRAPIIVLAHPVPLSLGGKKRYAQAGITHFVTPDSDVRTTLTRILEIAQSA